MSIVPDKLAGEDKLELGLLGFVYAAPVGAIATRAMKQKVARAPNVWTVTADLFPLET